MIITPRISFANRLLAVLPCIALSGLPLVAATQTVTPMGPADEEMIITARKKRRITN
ncbi:MAG: hypothetical protein QGH93_02255 [Gammaproteobacteria bacterium]|jgi:hypothetical protein|nr:hypothetical protein [Gammaproteobacteria bacterium]